MNTPHATARTADKSWWRDCPFTAVPPRTELTLAVLAAACQHPEPSIRSWCRSTIAEAIGHDRLDSAVGSVRRLLQPHQADLLEPLGLSEDDLWTVAAIQLFSIEAGNQAHVLRVTPSEALDLAGGVELAGFMRCRRVDRRVRGDWNVASGSAYHPSLLGPWVRASVICDISWVTSETMGGAAVIRIPGDRSCMLRMQNDLYAVRASGGLGEYRRWIFGSSGVDPGLNEMQAFASSIQKHSRMFPSGPTLSALGGVVAMVSDDVRIRFTTPESVLRLAAIANSPGAIQLAAIRPWGWLLLGRGEDRMGFVKSAHAVAPRWAQITKLPTLEVPTDLILALSRWIGPFAGHVTLELLESFR